VVWAQPPLQLTLQSVLSALTSEPSSHAFPWGKGLGSGHSGGGWTWGHSHPIHRHKKVQLGRICAPPI
jgi:hypothetical protein